MKKKTKTKKAAPELFKPELVKIADLKPHPRNYRVHTADQMAHIVASIETNGYYKNIVIAVDNTILAGHGTVEGAKSLGHAQVPALRLPIAPDDPRALKILTGDNETAKLAEVDDRLLSEILRDIAKNAEGLIGTGFDEKQLANLVFVTRHSDEIKNFDAAQEWVGLPKYDVQDEARSSELVLVISFKNPEDREQFVKEKKIQIRDKRGDRKWSTLWPYQERNDLKSVKFEADDK